LLGLSVRISPVAWMFVHCEGCVLSGRGLCVGLITHPEGSYRGWCVWVLSWILDNEEALTHWGCWAMVKKNTLKQYNTSLSTEAFTTLPRTVLLLSSLSLKDELFFNTLFRNILHLTFLYNVRPVKSKRYDY
jgi:hypothetical protein